MSTLVKMILVAGSMSLLATPASAIPFGVYTSGGLSAPASSTVGSRQWAGSGEAFDVAPGVISWGIGGIFCPCSWVTTLDGISRAGSSSSWEGGFLNFRRTFIAATK